MVIIVSVLWGTQYNINSAYEFLTSRLMSPQELFLWVLCASPSWNLRPLHIYVSLLNPHCDNSRFISLPDKRTQSFQCSIFKAKRGYFLHVVGFQFTLLHHLIVSGDLNSSHFGHLGENLWLSLIESLLLNKNKNPPFL